MFERLKRPFVAFVLGSLLLHALFWAGLTLSPAPKSPSPKVEIDYLELDPTDSKIEAKQIVEQKERLNEDKDENAKFLSAFDQKVEKQTRAQNQGKFKNQKSSGAQAEPRMASVPPDSSSQEEQKSFHNKKGLPSLSSLTPKFRPRPIAPALTGDQGARSQASQTDDYLRDIDVGLETRLSTREFIYYSYYARIKERIRQHWEPTVRGKVKMIYRQGRTIASTKDHITQVMITLNKVGELLRVDVVTPSGMVQLDDAAVEAFRAAQPFPNPPRGLIDEEGFIRIRWDFVLEANNNWLPNLYPHEEYALGVDR